MWDLVTHVLIGIFLGWYLFPFRDGSTIRSKVNEMLKNLFRAIITTMQKNKAQEKPVTKRKTTTPKTPKQDNVEFPSGKICSKCQDTVLMPLGGIHKGYWFCPSCKGMETAR